MWFSNKSEAFAREESFRELLLSNTDVTFDVQQGMMAMFIRAMYREFGNERAWSHNRVRDMEVASRMLPTEDKIAFLRRVDYVFTSKKPQPYGMWHVVLVDSDMTKTERFSDCPEGSVALMTGLLKPEKYGVKMNNINNKPCGYFVGSSAEFVYLDWRCGALLGKGTMYHGPTDEVSHLRLSSQQPTRLINRPMSERHLLIEAVTKLPKKEVVERNLHTVWALPGLRLNLHLDSPMQDLPTVVDHPRDVPMAVTIAGTKSGRDRILPVVKYIKDHITMFTGLYHLTPVVVGKWVSGSEKITIIENARIVERAMHMEPSYVYSEEQLVEALGTLGMHIKREKRLGNGYGCDWFSTVITTSEGKRIIIGDSAACLEKRMIDGLGKKHTCDGALMQLIHGMDILELPVEWLFALHAYACGRLPIYKFISEHAVIRYHQNERSDESLYIDDMIYNRLNSFSLLDGLKFHEAVATKQNGTPYGNVVARKASAAIVAEYGTFKIARTRATITKELSKKDRVRAIDLANERILNIANKV